MQAFFLPVQAFLLSRCPFLRTSGRTLARRLFATGTALAAAAAFAQAPAVPPVDPDLIARASDIAFRRYVDRARVAKTISNDTVLVSRVRHLAEPLVSNSVALGPNAAAWSSSLELETRPQPVALCFPNGRMIASIGLTERMQLTDGELAAVLAHVIAHALGGRDVDDALAAYRKKRGRDSPDPDVNRAALQLADILTELMVTPHYDSAAEKSADALALELLARSGIDPRASIEAWRKLARAGGATAPEILAMHPVTPQRLADIEADLPRVLSIYEKAAAERARAPTAPLRMPRR